MIPGGKSGGGAEAVAAPAAGFGCSFLAGADVAAAGASAVSFSAADRTSAEPATVGRRPPAGSLALSLEWTISLAVEIAREETCGRRRVGVTFLVGTQRPSSPAPGHSEATKSVDATTVARIERAVMLVCSRLALASALAALLAGDRRVGSASRDPHPSD